MLKFTRIAALALIALAVLLALVAFVVGRRASAVQAPSATPTHAASETPQGVSVVEAGGRLAAGVPIEPGQVRMASRTQAPDGAYLDVVSVVGLVPTQDVPEGTVLQQGLLAQGFSLQLRPGERALAVPVDELAAAGNRILPGDFVDVFLNLKGSQGYGELETAQARLLLSRLRVLSYGAHDLRPLQPAPQGEATASVEGDPRAADIRGSSASGSPSSSAAPEPPARSAVLAVPVADANRLLLGAQQGKLFLALRNPSDTGIADPSLFPLPRPVLAAARGLEGDRAAALAQPENDAYAGLDGYALAGRSSVRAAPAVATTAPAVRRSSAPRAPAGIEIIRGSGTP
ncbi:Flp pilus assembly protein CpaB [Stenotrophomonas sp. SORGH_AS_0321]|uniref:Flp pilus assembly protein CpaB n=1 Tax=Stenotrophomonas sp. SORGH_AS_0321 TaxID=3041787 RepID=UPI0028660AEE|nr:Flp pilus assembly protein CpaB [Stenotrophomonas sp. SORGH_AS_0321]MDR6094596.1 pilus assembly protein CpaB [Stenotrophomonas sp. SORGH_AS_0321]